MSCGDSLFDMFVAADASAGNDDTRVAVQGVVGGSPMNVALGLARFGHDSRYLTKLSTDIFGRRITHFLRQNGIDHSLSVPTELNTTLAMVETDEGGAAQYVFYINGSADVSLTEAELPTPLPDDVRVLHFGSYSTAVEPVAGSLRALAKRESSSRLISYDPNLRLSIEPDTSVWKSTFNTFASSANIIKASDEDIEALFGQNGEDAFVAESFSLGAQLVYITRGPNGASAFSVDGRSVTVPGVAVDVVDTVGAGDTFQASILHWLAANGHVTESASIEGTVDLQGSVDFAMRAAGVTCTRRGADLPTLAEVQ